jgi:hypothetical protein
MPRHSSSGQSLASHRGGPRSNPGLVKWDLWWTKWRWGRFSQSTSVSPANLHSTIFSIIIFTRGRYNRPFSGRRAEWTQLGLHPPLCEFKKKKFTCPLWSPYHLTRRHVTSEVADSAAQNAVVLNSGLRPAVLTDVSYWLVPWNTPRELPWKSYLLHHSEWCYYPTLC